MKDSAQLFGSPSPEAAKFAIDIFNFEKRIAEITPDISYLNNPVKVNNKMKVTLSLLKFLSATVVYLNIRNVPKEMQVAGRKHDMSDMITRFLTGNQGEPISESKMSNILFTS